MPPMPDTFTLHDVNGAMGEALRIRLPAGYRT